MTEKEKKERIARLKKELKELQAVPKSDWHKAFEAFLRFKTYRYKGVTIQTEVEIGADVPRTDYVILRDDGADVFEESIFRIFRKINILEYKNPHDSLNERTIYKAAGYAGLLIGNAEHEGDVPADQVTISIFRSQMNPDLFRKWGKAGRIVETDTFGIYKVIGIADVPFQIVITDELAGDEYAACRALKDKADAIDLRRVIKDGDREKDGVMREHYRTFLTFLAERNPDTFNEIRSASKIMKDALMELMKDDIDEKVNNAVRDAVSSTEAAVKQADNVSAIRNIMESFGVTLERAMETMKIPPSQQATYANLVNKMS